MILDRLNEFSNSQALTATAASTNVVDQLAAGDALGRELYFYVQIDVALSNAADDGTVIFALQTSITEAFSSPIVLYATAAIAEATLVAGYEVLRVRIPKGAKRYLRAYYTVGGTGDLNAGSLSAFLTRDVQDSVPQVAQ